jgi:hypothetical protein
VAVELLSSSPSMWKDVIRSKYVRGRGNRKDGLGGRESSVVLIFMVERLVLNWVQS